MHFFNSRFKPMFILRANRAQFKQFSIRQRLFNVLASDYLEADIRLHDNSLKRGCK